MTGPGVDEDLDYDDEDDYDEPHDDNCYNEETGRLRCNPCLGCGGHRCPGYCDDYQTYNLRPEETGG